MKFPQQNVALPDCQENWEYLQINNSIFNVGDVKSSVQVADHAGWIVMDGRVFAPYPALARLLTSLGYATVPDARDRSIIGASATHVAGTSLGQAAPTMPAHTTGNDAPDHTHTYIYCDICCTIDGGSAANVDTTFGTLQTSGASARHTHSVTGVGSATDGNYHPVLILNHFIHT